MGVLPTTEDHTTMVDDTDTAMEAGVDVAAGAAGAAGADVVAVDAAVDVSAGLEEDSLWAGTSI